MAADNREPGCKMFILQLTLIICVFLCSKYDAFLSYFVISCIFLFTLFLIISRFTNHHIRLGNLKPFSTRCNNLLVFKCAKNALVYLLKTTCNHFLQKLNILLSPTCIIELIGFLNMVCSVIFRDLLPLFITNWSFAISTVLNHVFVLALIQMCLIFSTCRLAIPVSQTAQFILLSFARCESSFSIYKPFSRFCKLSTPPFRLAFRSDTHELFTVNSLPVTKRIILLAVNQLNECFHACHLTTTNDKRILGQLLEVNNHCHTHLLCTLLNG